MEQPRLKGDSTHVASNPLSRNAEVLAEAPSPPEERGRRVNTNDFGPASRECERVSSVAATKVNNARAGTQLKTAP
jgi:hypothetical protein